MNYGISTLDSATVTLRCSYCGNRIAVEIDLSVDVDFDREYVLDVGPVEDALFDAAKENHWWGISNCGCRERREP